MCTLVLLLFGVGGGVIAVFCRWLMLTWCISVVGVGVFAVYFGRVVVDVLAVVVFLWCRSQVKRKPAWGWGRELVTQFLHKMDMCCSRCCISGFASTAAERTCA